MVLIYIPDVGEKRTWSYIWNTQIDSYPDCPNILCFYKSFSNNLIFFLRTSHCHYIQGIKNKNRKKSSYMIRAMFVTHTVSRAIIRPFSFLPSYQKNKFLFSLLPVAFFVSDVAIRLPCYCALIKP